LLERAAEAGARRGIRETFTSLGLDVSSPKACIEAQKDMSFLRDMRKRAGIVATAIIAGAAGFGGGLSALLQMSVGIDKPHG
jgi:hypothetical protein